jgi:hypothetical protein
MHLEAAGLTRAFKHVAATFQAQRLGRPGFVEAQADSVRAFVEMSDEDLRAAGLNKEGIEQMLAIAESEKRTDLGLPTITGPDFTSVAGMRQVCARPNALRNVHADTTRWVPLITFVANLVFVWLFVPVEVITLVVGWIMVVVVLTRPRRGDSRPTGLERVSATITEPKLVAAPTGTRQLGSLV